MRADYEVAQRGPPDVEELQRALDSGLEEVERMSGVVADLLTLSRIDAHEERLERRELDVSALVDATVAKLAAFAAVRGVKVVREGGCGEVCRGRPIRSIFSGRCSIWSRTRSSTRRGGRRSRCAWPATANAPGSRWPITARA